MILHILQERVTTFLKILLVHQLLCYPMLLPPGGSLVPMAIHRSVTTKKAQSKSASEATNARSLS